MHVAIIPDGNRRWAKDNNKSVTQGYEKGIEIVQKTVEEAIHLGIEYATFFVLSTENTKRSPLWLRGMKSLVKKYLLSICAEAVRNGCFVRFIGDTGALGEDVDALINSVKNPSSKEIKLHLTFCIGYSGRADIMKAVEKMIAAKAKSEDLPNFLSTRDLPDPDFIIRTSGEMRMSNFLLFESAYSELFFIKKHWPDFTKKDLQNIVKDFKQRERRFGL